MGFIKCIIHHAIIISISYNFFLKMELIKDNHKGKTYQANNFKILYRKSGSVSGDNSENVHELIYLITGSARMTLEDKSWTIEGPAKVEFPARTYHKIEALTDISMILFEK
jgi:mannose-6-phosphate isomerase-like protein (cupin superfamily)